MRILYQKGRGMSSHFYQKILVVATIHGELFSFKLSRKGDRRGVIANDDVFHACIVPDGERFVKP
tara:strand:- start:115 stop:309 length:195 start_codon:yes stop_codon:yes gene_type:complete